MDLKYRMRMNSIPFRLLSFFYIVYNNSSLATFGKNIGFYCDDESIKKPYSGDSVRVTYLFFIILAVLPLCIYMTECLMRKEILKDGSHSGTSRCRFILKFYYSGFLYLMFITEVIKVYFSELRPHFFYSCLPNMTNVDCSKGLITDFNCTNDSSSWIENIDIYKSFPSGHAVLSCYACIFTTMYMYSKKKDAVNTSLKTWWYRLIPFLSFVWAVICCVSRILDNRHFWWDVLFGGCIGMVGGAVTAQFVLMKMACNQS